MAKPSLNDIHVAIIGKPASYIPFMPNELTLKVPALVASPWPWLCTKRASHLLSTKTQRSIRQWGKLQGVLFVELSLTMIQRWHWIRP
jgi:hypothetical protein